MAPVMLADAGHPLDADVSVRRCRVVSVWLLSTPNRLCGRQLPGGEVGTGGDP